MVTSISPSAPNTETASLTPQCHCRAATMLTWKVSITITPVTAMP